MDEQRKYPEPGKLYQEKRYKVQCGHVGCFNNCSLAVDTRVEAERALRQDMLWGRESNGLWFCPVHIERNAGAAANLGRRASGARKGGVNPGELLTNDPERSGK